MEEMSFREVVSHGEAYNKPSHRLADVADVERRLFFCVLQLTRYTPHEQFSDHLKQKKNKKKNSNNWLGFEWTTNNG